MVKADALGHVFEAHVVHNQHRNQAVHHAPQQTLYHRQHDKRFERRQEAHTLVGHAQREETDDDHGGDAQQLPVCDDAAPKPGDQVQGTDDAEKVGDVGLRDVVFSGNNRKIGDSDIDDRKKEEAREQESEYRASKQ